MKVSKLIAIMALFGVQAVELEQRYFKSNGEPINLAQTTGHLRLELKKIKKTVDPVPIENSMLELSCGEGKHT